MSGYQNSGTWTGLQVDALLTKAGTALQPTDDADGLGSGTASDGQVLTADGAGGTAWADMPDDPRLIAAQLYTSIRLGAR